MWIQPIHTCVQANSASKKFFILVRYDFVDNLSARLGSLRKSALVLNVV